MFVRQSEMLIPEEELVSESPVSYEEDFEDLSYNADLHVFNDQMIEGCRWLKVAEELILILVLITERTRNR